MRPCLQHTRYHIAILEDEVEVNNLYVFDYSCIVHQAAGIARVVTKVGACM